MHDSINLQRDEIFKKIKQWLKEIGYTIEGSPASNTEYHATFYTVSERTGNKGIHYDIEISENSLDEIHVSTIFGYKLKEKITKFDLDNTVLRKQRTILFETLKTHNVIFNMHSQLVDIEFKIWKIIYFDGLSKHTLSETIGDIFAAYRHSVIALRQASKDSSVSNLT